MNGINTDGGGSATLVERGVLVNEPSETSCPGSSFEGQTCERPVTTIACLHASRREGSGASMDDISRRQGDSAAASLLARYELAPTVVKSP